MWCILCVYTICVIGSILLDDDVPLELAIERVRRLRVDEQHDQVDLTADTSTTGTPYMTKNGEADPTQSNGVLTKLTSQELVTLDSFGTEYYTNRVYKGLDMITPVEREYDYSVHEGQSGLAAGYQRQG